MSADRPGLACAAKEIVRKMANPGHSDLEKMRRVAKYMLGPEFGTGAPDLTDVCPMWAALSQHGADTERSYAECPTSRQILPKPGQTRSISTEFAVYFDPPA